MADTTIKLKVLLEAAGIKPTQKQLEMLNKKLSGTAAKMGQVSNAANKTKRNFEGVAGRANNAGKDFARMSQGMGGLVQAYATIAANVFALSSAFLVLRRAADLSSMIKSAEDFSAKFGVSVTRITKRMQEASGGALDFAEALPSINKAVSAGVGIEQMEQLTIAATKASQTFGGTTTEALNRFISASQRGRVEIIQTLGVVIKTEQAYKEYAASIGKTSLELSAFDRQQAILNATIEASEKVFGAITIDPNPFTRFASTMVDVKDNILTTITDGITPLISSFNQSKNAAVALMAFIAASVGSRIFPQLTALLSGFTAASIKSTAAAKAASLAAIKQREETNKEAQKSTGKFTEKKLKEQLQLEEASYKKRLKKHKSFQQSLFNQDGTINAKRLNQQKAALRRQEEAIKRGSGIQKGLSSDLSTVRKQIDARVRLGQVTNAVRTSEQLANQTRARSTTLTKQATAAVQQYYTSTKAVLIGLKSGVVTGFSKSFQTMQSNVSLGIKKMIIQWKLFARTIGTSGQGSLKNFSEAFGRTVGVVAGGISRLISGLTSFLIVFSLLRLGWELYGDRIKGISKEQRELLNSFSDLGDVFKEVTKSNSKYLSSLQGGVDTLSAFIAEAEFLRGTFDTLATATNDFNAALFASTGITEIKALASYFEDASKTYKNLIKDVAEGSKSNTQQLVNASFQGAIILPGNQDLGLNKDLKETSEIAKNLQINTKAFGVALKEINEVSLEPIIRGLASTLNLLEKTGFESLGKQLEDKVVSNLKEIGDEGAVLAALFKAGNFVGLTAAIKAIGEDDAGKATAAIKALSDGTETLDKNGRSLVGTFISSGRALEEVNRNITTYLLGLEKTKAASVPNKAIFNLLLDSERALNDLINSAEAGGAAKKLEDVIDAPDLKALRDFIDLQGDTTPEETLTRIREELQAYNAVIQDSINNASKFKVIQNELFKLKNEEVTSDRRRLDIIKELNALAISKAEIDKQTAQNQLDVARINLRKLEDSEGATDRAIENQKALVIGLEAEVEGHELVIQALKEKLDYERKLASIRDESIAAAIAVNKNLTSQFGILQKLSANDAQDLKLQKTIYNLKKDSFALEAALIQSKIDAFPINSKTTEEDSRQKATYESQLELLRLQTYELERQELLKIKATSQEQAGVSIFDEEGLALAAKFFVNKIRDEARSLKTTFQILGEGLAKNINDAFDKAVDTLLEGVWGKGGRDFARQMVETIKAGLRETFGEALKTQIRRALGQLFDGTTDPNQGLIDANKGVENELRVFNSNINKINTGMGTGTSTSDNAITEGMKGFAPEMYTPIVSAVDVLKDSVENGSADTKSGLMNIISTLFTLIQAVVSSIGGAAAGGGGFFKNLLGAAFTAFSGGVAGPAAGASTVGTTASSLNMGFPTYADGGVVNRPQLAVIGEGKTNEAVVPLPNNREIPVDLQGASGDTINIEQNFDFRNADVSAIPVLRQEAKAIEERTFNRVFSEINKGGRFAKMTGRRR